MYTKDDWKKASDATIFNRDTIQKSNNAACYCCLCHFKASQVEEYVDDDDVTAICPLCGVDAVLGDATGLPIHDLEYLQAMHTFGFTMPA
jgi:hypothetical protein